MFLLKPLDAMEGTYMVFLKNVAHDTSKGEGGGWSFLYFRVNKSVMPAKPSSYIGELVYPGPDGGATSVIKMDSMNTALDFGDYWILQFEYRTIDGSSVPNAPYVANIVAYFG